MAFRVELTATAEVELLGLHGAGREMAARLLDLLKDDLWRDDQKTDLYTFDGEGEDALPVFAAIHERASVWFVEDEQAEAVVVLHISLLSRFRYPE